MSEIGLKSEITIRQNKKGRTYTTGGEKIRENKECEITWPLK
jgi:hypothetical protein